MSPAAGSRGGVPESIPGEGRPQQATVRGLLRPRPRAAPWHVVYYLLAAFNLLTMSALLYLNHYIVSAYARSVKASEHWTRRLTDYSDLGRLAAAVNAPGNDVFDSRDVAGESKRMSQALELFRRRVEALRAELRSDVARAEAQPLIGCMDEVARSIDEMAVEARALFEHLGRDEWGHAGASMATMDRKYAVLVGALRGLVARVASLQAQGFERQTAAAVSLQRFQFAGAGLVLLMLAAAIAYGRKIAEHAEQDRRDRARYVGQLEEVEETLRRAHAEMERRVEERTLALRDSEAALRRAAAEWQRTFEAIESAVMILDTSGRVLRLNRAAAQLSGHADDGALGTPVLALGRGEPWGCAAEVAQGVQRRRASQTLQAHGADGRAWEVSGSLVAEPDPSDERVIVVARDVTRLVELQESVRREERMSAMGSLVAGVAHEVRNPLFGISSTLDAFEARHGERAGFDKYLTVLKREVERLRVLMQDLLDYGKPPSLEPAAVDLDEVVADSVRACEALAERAQVRIVKPYWGLGVVPMDRSRMLQVFQNLIQNAVLHSSPGASVVLDAGRSEEDGRGWTWVTVQDSGDGFRAEDIPHLFEPFFTRRAGGTGLGLSVAQRIVVQHGGVLSAANRSSGGAVVSVRLPDSQPEDAP